MRGLLLPWTAVASWGGQFPQLSLGWFKVDASVGYTGHVAPSLASKALEREWASVASCTLSPYTGFSIPFLMAPSPHVLPHTSCQKTVGLRHLARATPTITRVQKTIVASYTVLPSAATFLGTTQGAGITIASSGLCQGSH